jgi:hypothetical protein
MKHGAGVLESSHDRASLIESCGEDNSRPRNIKGGGDPVLIAQEAMPRAVEGLIGSRVVPFGLMAPGLLVNVFAGSMLTVMVPSLARRKPRGTKDPEVPNSNK